jgi:amino acid transporter
VAEDLGPWQAISRSTSLLKKTWGEQIVGNFSIGVIFLLIFILVLVLGAAAIALLGSGAVALALIIILVLVLLGLGLASSALHGIFAAAVYSYTTTGQLGGFFREDLIRGAFRERRGLL